MAEYVRRLTAASRIILSDDENRKEEQDHVDAGAWGVSGTLKPHQVEGVSWLIRRYTQGVNVILGDEMGLGKTLQAICFLSYLKFQQKRSGPFLILCPLSVIEGWISEFARFSPNLKVLKYVGDKMLRCGLRKKMREHVSKQCSKGDPTLSVDVFLTTYDIALLDQEFLSQVPWCYAVIDEAQRLKNASSVLYAVLEHQFILPRRLLLTGTPIQNSVSELWALLHFCMPILFGSLDEFVEAFNEAESSFSDESARRRAGQFKALKYILKAFLLRRTKSMLVESGTLTLPPLTEITVLAPLVQLQKKVYVSILRRELPNILSSSSGVFSQHTLQNIVIQLRKACSHPYLFSGIEPEPFSEGEHLVLASGKLVILDKLLQKLQAENHRVLLFAQMTQTLDILQDFLELRGYNYERLDGSVRAEERFAAIRSFSQPPVNGASVSHLGQDDAFVFMISTRAGGVGLNLVGADTVIFYEQDWNPQVDKQALQRAHRIGQVNHVLSINLVTSGTVEEVIMRRAACKLQLSHNVIGGDNVAYSNDKEISVENAELRSSIVFGLHKFCPSDVVEESFDDRILIEVDALAEKVLQVRLQDPAERDDRMYEISPIDMLDEGGLHLKRNYTSASLDPGFDEASYRSWIEKFKDAPLLVQSSSSDVDFKKQLLAEKRAEIEVDKQKKAEEKRLRKWEALGYQSLAVEEPPQSMGENVLSDSGSIEFVFGDCTKPAKRCLSEPTVIFSCADNSGVWGRGGMFDALSNLSSNVPDAYERAFECSDLHLGDLHLVRINGISNQERVDAVGGPQWVALAIVQSYNPRHKVPRSNISLPDLEKCISKACFSAAQVSASIHMPRIGYQDGSGRSEWYTVERLLHKYASTYAVKILVYYFRRAASVRDRSD